VTPGLSIPLAEIAVTATTPGGPGGQHANRTASRVEVRFDAARSRALSAGQRDRVVAALGPVVRAGAAEHRSQARNKELALQRLAGRLARVLATAPPRRPTRPGRGAAERRLSAKRQRGETKRLRRGPGADD
jgi:ribosome-associated protein